MLGDPATLARKDKIFAMTPDAHKRVWGCHKMVLPFQPGHCLPLPLDRSGQPLTLVLPVGDDIAFENKQGLLDDLRLFINIENMTEGDRVLLKINGRIVKEECSKTGTGLKDWLLYAPDPEVWIQGQNKLEFCVMTSKGSDPLTLKNVVLYVYYR